MPTIDLSSWEPFHAYLFRIATWGSFALALASLALAAVIPMGYCHLGCPTGRLLDYLRRSAVSDRIQTSDYVALGLLVTGAASNKGLEREVYLVLSCPDTEAGAATPLVKYIVRSSKVLFAC